MVCQEYFNLREACEYLGIGYSTMKKSGRWVSWGDYGVVPSRPGKRTLKFKKSDLERMMEMTKVSR